MLNLTLPAIVEALAGRRVLIIGDIVLDRYLWGDVRRISPEAPVPVVDLSGMRNVPGGAANTAANVVSMGGRALLGGVVGRDPEAQQLREVLGQAGVDFDGIVTDESRPTTTKLRIVARGQQIVRVDHELRAPISCRMENELLSWAAKQVANVDACILSDYGKGTVTSRLAADFLAQAHSAGRPMVVDPKGADYSKYRRATVITPNTLEARRAIGREQDDLDLLHVARELLEIVSGSAVLITRGEEGMSLYRAGAPIVHIPTAARHVFDVTGAGDTVVSALALALAAGAPMEQAAWLANAAAGVVVGKAGTSVVTADDLMRELSLADTTTAGIPS
jgi:D-beta-D-heptose 7-phosphate kinase/D-beta-D-heptose 1-phosphate adenosyltransferase